MFTYLHNTIADKYGLKHNTACKVQVKINKIISDLNYHQKR